VPNLNGIEIDASPDFIEDVTETNDVDSEEVVPSLHDGHPPLPNPTFLDIVFDIYIPFRIQAELLEREEEDVWTYTEHFRVYIHYTYHFPVAFVQMVDPSKPPFAAHDGVVVVRKFLEMELEEDDTNISFQTLGPSPFHASFTVAPGDFSSEEKQGLQYDATTRQSIGYADIVFSYNKLRFKNPQAAAESIFEEIAGELGFFYQVVGMRVQLSEAWEPVEGLVDKLVEKRNTKSWLRRIAGWFSISAELNDAVTGLVNFKSRQISADSFLQKYYRSTYSRGLQTVFQSFVDEEMEDRYPYPTDELAKITEFLEARRVKSVESFVVILAAIIGGVVGSLVTIYLSSPKP
jgi:hypothetical protein